MKKNGFTLIELLAVIVILAIIALIATPIILGIINDAREKANERSVELYASAIRNGIAAYQLREMKEVAAGTYTSETLPFDVEADGDVVCETIDIYEDGGVYVADCTVNGVAVEYTYGTKKEKVIKISDVCTPVTIATTGNVPSGAYNIGDEYTCEVKEGTSYTFFILSKEENQVNLIMDSNIREDGTPVKETNSSDNGIVSWLSSNDYALSGGEVTDEMLNDNGACQYGGVCALNTYGPITAIEYLQEATKDWTNTNELTINKFTYCDYKGTCIDKQMKEYVVSARLPYYDEIEIVSSSTPWLLNYLDDGGNQINKVAGLYGYWTLSSASFDDAWFIACIGSLTSEASGHEMNVAAGAEAGVRPVINLSI